jgi:hypothetical protein
LGEKEWLGLILGKRKFHFSDARQLLASLLFSHHTHAYGLAGIYVCLAMIDAIDATDFTWHLPKIPLFHYCAGTL